MQRFMVWCIYVLSIVIVINEQTDFVFTPKRIILITLSPTKAVKRCPKEETVT